MKEPRQLDCSCQEHDKAIQQISVLNVIAANKEAALISP
jgi:hypothetical protein